jgi:hypothetical protein
VKEMNMKQNPAENPAFPYSVELKGPQLDPYDVDNPVESGVIRTYAFSGMTLRDYFAAKAMLGMMIRPGSINPKDDSDYAYLMADAMLKARETKW